MRYLFILLGGIVLLMGADRLYQRAVKFGLHAKFASPPFALNQEWELPPLSAMSQEEIDAILAQPFRFFARGSQAYAFISPDGKYILKLLKQHKWKPNHLWGYLPGSNKTQFNRNKGKAVLQSCCTALRTVPEDTAVVYAHLNPTPLQIANTTLIDNHGKSWDVNLSKSCFLLQKRVDGFYAHIDQMMREGRIEDARASIHATIELLHRFITLGIYDHNAILRKNFGFIGNQPIQFDIGKFYCDPARTPCRDSVPIVTRGFRRWLAQHYPTLCDELDEAIRTHHSINLIH